MYGFYNKQAFLKSLASYASDKLGLEVRREDDRIFIPLEANKDAGSIVLSGKGLIALVVDHAKGHPIARHLGDNRIGLRRSTELRGNSYQVTPRFDDPHEVAVELEPIGL